MGTLGCWTQELRHRKALEALEALEALAFAPAPYEGWDEAEAHFGALEALARWLEDLGL